MSEKTYSASEIGVLAAFTPFIVAGMLMASIPGAMYSGWVEMKLWNWFIAPYFHLNPISFWVMFGSAAPSSHAIDMSITPKTERLHGRRCTSPNSPRLRCFS